MHIILKELSIRFLEVKKMSKNACAEMFNKVIIKKLFSHFYRNLFENETKLEKM